jgi:SAM-dependent methyltransferase
MFLFQKKYNGSSKALIPGVLIVVAPPGAIGWASQRSWKEHNMVCRMCKGSKLAKILDLGFHPPSDQFLRKEQLRDPVVYYPLEVMMCMDCSLAQLSYVVSPEVLYRHDYPYESSTTMMGRLHWKEFAQTVTQLLDLGPEDLVVDVGSNVGVLLEAFSSQGCRVLGVDPASNIVIIAMKRGIETFNDFFSIDVAQRILKEKGPATVITATNVFAHVDDLYAFMEAISLLLNKRGIFIFEAPYFVNLINKLEYDTVYHEHLSYFLVKPLVTFFQRFGMEIFDIQQRDIHGGSFRVFVSREGQFPIAPTISELLKQEEEMGIYTLEVLEAFANAVKHNREDLIWLLRRLKHEGKRIAGVSAPAKGMTLLNYCRLGTETLDFVSEKSTLKIGRFTPGTHIPVVSDEEFLEARPDYALLLAWNFAEEIMNNLKVYSEQGGKFIIPIPKPHIVE